MSLMDFFDFLTAQIMLPVGALLTCVYVGWVAPCKVVQHEFTNGSNARSILFTVYLFAARFVCPVCIILIFLNQFGVI
jgi:NSS family neurotransmitter:Na+ symporter